MKKILLVMGLWLAVFCVRAQTFAEWFEQNKTRLQYYGQQVAALEVYASDLEKGYQIAEGGLQTIGAIKHGEFDAHNGFYHSLETVSPSVSAMTEVAEIVALQIATVERFSKSMAGYRQNNYLGNGELTVIGNVYSRVLSAGIADVGTLSDILTDGKFKMTDADRMEKVRRLDQETRDRYAFTSSFTGQTDLLVAQRQASDLDIQNIKVLYGLS